MTRFIIIFVISISSCASIDYSYFGSLASLFPQKFVVSKTDFNNIEYSFIHIRSKNNNAIYVLSEITNNNEFIWIGPEYEKIKTINGLITYFETNDYKYELLSSNTLNSIYESKWVTNFYSPDALFLPTTLFFHKDIESTFIQLGNHYETKKRKIRKTIPAIKFATTDYVEFNDKGLAIYTEQKLSPLRKPLFIEFYYKY